MQSSCSDFENDIKANALQKIATATTTTAAITAPRIALTKTTFLTPIQKSPTQQQQQLLIQQQQNKPKQLYTTLTAKQTTPSGSVTSTNLGKVVIKDFKGIVKPIIATTITTVSTNNTATIASTLVTTTTATTTSTTLPTSSHFSEEVEVGGNLNVAIVAAKRPQLTIVATKTTALVDNISTSLGVTAVTSATTATIASPTTATTINSTTATADTSTESNKMEHSYIRDTTPKPQNNIEISNGLQPARTILVRRPPQCPSCHTNPVEEDLSDAHQAPIPSYNEIAAKEAMNECARIAKYVKNINLDDDDWESRVNQIGWSNMQKNLFSKVARILDNDQLGRLSNAGRPNEAMQRRVVVDKSASRMRKALASVAWDSRLTQWLHCLLMDCLPSTYMASYLDILQTLKSKLPTLMDKMLFGRPLNVSQELLAPVMKKKWEPQIATKIRKLAHNAVIVALPSMPTSGPVPNRLQKWYQHLATITQIVQVTLPMTSGHISRQPLEQVAEQIVSLTRVKIHELRNENSQRSIILIGFNAGASLALQVAMSENVACVVCMGFAYNTYNGVRGTPDDRILDIKVPILFVVGQNSARSSPEEIESLREKMQSESSLVVVGSADDVLRVPKSRRKIENVTQSMVDTMVVDEVYDFIKKILTNPPGPRTPTVINSTFYNKLNKTTTGEKTTGVYQRKRKNEGGDQEATPAKSKHITKIQQMHTSTPVMVGKSQPLKKHLSPSNITNDDLNMAIQSLISDSNDTDLNTSNVSTDSNPQKLITNFELVTQPAKVAPIKTTLLNTQQKQLIIGSTPAVGTKIKMIPSNQFVQLKPTPLQSQSKIYTIKTSPVVGATQGDATGGPRIGSIVTTSPSTTSTGQHIFTLKTPNGQTTQFATAVGGQPKYTVIKNANGNTTLQLSSAKTLHPVSTVSPSPSTSSSNLDLANIIDMPILFADNEGNLSDASSSTETKPSTVTTGKSSSGVGQLIISQKIIKEANPPSTTTPAATASTSSGTYVINKPGTFLQSQQIVGNKPNKVVFINRNTMKPCPNILSRSNISQQLNKYTKVVLTNPKTATTTLVPRPGTHITTTSTSPIASTVKQINLQALNHATTTSPVTTPTRPSGILNVQTKNLPQIQIINNPNATFISTDKPQIRNIVVKSGGLKQLPPHLTTQLLNRNLTVRKLPPGSVTITSSPVHTSAAQDVATAIDTASSSPASSSSSSASNIQTSPKIITLNPINRTTPTTKGD
ncbi:KAT8 regulatory NSL complex subunit 3 isoform X2 [Lucilia sericata]|uniref:KAT8 regulatory NSL complex subunit 3 isoform X2 n=1 Tax=Lucilia sericata TaxID=13632 RepID=UPI0018A847A7|nr:KAT8 regulatory NSL complex subunit 3 isoform X2 [Lucilia sericata]